MNRWFRMRALAWFLIAAVYYIVARGVSSAAANGLSSGLWFDFADRIILLFLLIVGFGAMGYVGQRQQKPVRAMGLGLRAGGWGEFALGAAIGWAGVAVCALLIAIFGALVVVFYTGWRQYALIPLALAILLIGSLAEEVAFRGYPFQRLMDATHPVFATLLVSALFALAHIANPGASPASFLMAMFAGWLLSIAYLRTRALWVGWGIHFAWNASMAVLFGLPLSGLTRFSPVIHSTAIGSTWLTGFDYGPEGSAVGIGVILVLILPLLYATRGLKYKYAQPVIVPAGIPVDGSGAAWRPVETSAAPRPAAPTVWVTPPPAPAPGPTVWVTPPPEAEAENSSTRAEADGRLPREPDAEDPSAQGEREPPSARRREDAGPTVN